MEEEYEEWEKQGKMMEWECEGEEKNIRRGRRKRRRGEENLKSSNKI